MGWIKSLIRDYCKGTGDLQSHFAADFVFSYLDYLLFVLAETVLDTAEVPAEFSAEIL